MFYKSYTLKIKNPVIIYITGFYTLKSGPTCSQSLKTERCKCLIFNVLNFYFNSCKTKLFHTCFTLFQIILSQAIILHYISIKIDKSL